MTGCSRAILGALVVASSLYSVQSDGHLKDIVDTAVGAGNFATLAAALTKANLVDTLKGSGPFTVFAPTDAAFEKALKALGITAEQLLARKDLADILTFHVASGKTLSTDLKNDMKVTTLQSQPNLANQVTVTIDGTTVKIGDATVTTADLECSNGVIHVIDTVLLPAQNNIVQTAVQAGTFKTLAAALTQAKLIETLSGAGPFTVFAPTDAAFEKALKALGVTAEQLLARKDLGDILKFHVASGKTMSTDLKNDMKVTTLQGQPNLANQLTVTIDGTTVKIGGATVATADLGCSNGVIHVVDTVLLPAQNNIVQTAVQAGIFKTLAAALTQAKLIETLSGEGPFTVFAPPDAAFEKALKALGVTAEELLARKDLGDILKFHVASGKTMSTDLKDGMKVKTVQGEELTVAISGAVVKVNDATVTGADIEVSNGVVHVIDAVLLPGQGGAKADTTTAKPSPSADPEKKSQTSAAAPREARNARWVAMAVAAVIGSLLTYA